MRPTKSLSSKRNSINCVHCDDHFFIFISFPQFIYDLFHISLTNTFIRAFRPNRELHCISLRKKAIIVTSNTAQRSFFSITIFFLERKKKQKKKKLARKAPVNTERVYWIVLMPPGHPINQIISIWPSYR